MRRELAGRLRRVSTAALVIGLCALAACWIGAAFHARQFFISYLFGYLFWFGLAVGCLTVTMIQYLTGGRWGYPIRRFLEAGFSTLPLMVVLFVPVLFGLNELYPWAREELDDKILERRRPYMDETWFTARAFFCFVLWTVLAWLLRRWSLQQDQTDDVGPSRRLRQLSGIGVLLFPLTATFVYVDWVLSLENEWYSSIFSLIILSGQVLSAFAFTTIMLKCFEHEEAIAQTMTGVTYHQLGNLLLTFVMFWTYVSFGQLLIVYSANLPHEIEWYLHRIAGGWKWVVIALGVFHFFLPFALLLFRAVKERPNPLVWISGGLLLAHMIAVYWMVSPSFHQEGLRISWLDFTAPIGIGGVWLAAFFWFLMRAPLAPRNDPRMEQELAYETE